MSTVMSGSQNNIFAGLERKHLMKKSREGIPRDTLKKADPEPDDEDAPGDNDGDDEHVIEVMPEGDDAAETAEPEAGDDETHADRVAALDEEAANAPGWVDDNISHKFNDHMMKTASEMYHNAKKIMNPDDPRMKIVESALWTWLLRVLSIIENVKDSPKVNVKLDQLGKRDQFKQLRELVLKSKTQELNSKEWTLYGNLIELCANAFITDGADAVVSTIAQLSMDWSKDVKFGLIIVDEATVMNEAQLVQVWRDDAHVLCIGDQLQLGVVALSKQDTNPFVHQLTYPPYVRFIDNNWPYAMLLEVMRMTVGLEALCSEIFYEGELKAGESTAIDHPSRQMSRTWHTKIRERHPTLRHEPEGLVYPVLLNVTSASDPDPAGGHSRVNKYNVSVAVDHVCWAVKAGIVKAHEIGIATPYGGQVQLYIDTLAKVGKSQPELETEKIQVGSMEFWSKDVAIGTTEWWQGRQAEYMIVDFVRATNDYGELGFMADARRLNVLLSRQRQALVIIGDKNCTKLTTTDPQEIREKDSQNRRVAKVFLWMQEKGRVVEISSDELSQDFVKLAPLNADTDNSAAAAGGLGATDNSAATGGGWPSTDESAATGGGLDATDDSAATAADAWPPTDNAVPDDNWDLESIKMDKGKKPAGGW